MEENNIGLGERKTRKMFHVWRSGNSNKVIRGSPPCPWVSFLDFAAGSAIPGRVRCLLRQWKLPT
eukprot:9594203-Prorocentrum_lima.AAC.1